MGYYRSSPSRPYGGGIAFPPVTPVNRILLIAMGSVWGAQLLLELLFGVRLEAWLGLVPAWTIRGMFWQPATYLFLHSTSDLFHLLLNGLMLWMIGGELERHWGGRRYLGYFFACGIGAGLFVIAQSLLRGVSGVTIGASGAVYGMILAYGTIFAERVILFMLIFPMKARTLAILLFAIAFLSNLTRPGDGISHIAHLGGMIVGWIVLKRAWRVRHVFEDLRWRIRRRRFKVMPPRDEDRWIH